MWVILCFANTEWDLYRAFNQIISKTTKKLIVLDIFYHLVIYFENTAQENMTEKDSKDCILIFLFWVGEILKAFNFDRIKIILTSNFDRTR